CGSQSNASSTTLTKCSRFIRHPLKQIRGTLTPSSRHHLPRLHRHLLCRRLRLPLPLLPRLALVEQEHRQLPSDQKGQSRGTLDVFSSCQMVRLVPIDKRMQCKSLGEKTCSSASYELILMMINQ